MKKLISFKKNEIILKDGEIGEGFYILEEGELSVVRDGLVLNEISQKGAIFGELSGLLKYKRKASIRAKTDVKAIHIEKSLESVVAQNPNFAVKLIRSLGRRLYTMNELVIEGNQRNNILDGDQQDDSFSEDDEQVKVLIVEDKPMVLKQLRDLCEANKWHPTEATDSARALELCKKLSFSAIIISCSLESDSTLSLRRKLKTSVLSKNTPVVGLVVQGDKEMENTAQEVGFEQIIHKPINNDLASTSLYRAMNLDSSAQYFKLMEEVLYFKIPRSSSTNLISDIKANLKPRIVSTVNAGIGKIIVDVSELNEMGEGTLDLVGEFAEYLEDYNFSFQVVLIGDSKDRESWLNLDGCENWDVCESFDSAMEKLSIK
jgi:CheY-like chemotaxis protein